LLAVIINRLFILQIVQGPVLAEDLNLKETKSREIKSTRGNIYDRNGVLLASNALSYSIAMEDSTKITSNDQRNAIIYQLINIIEENGDTLDNEFYIIQNEQGEFEFTIKDAALARFRKNAFAYLPEDDKIKLDKQNATAQEVYEFLRNGTGNNYTEMFGISDEYTVEETLKIMSIRYALFCNYPKFLQIIVASNVSDTTKAAVLESSSELPGVEIKHQTQRVYNDSIYFAHILGYTGLISAEELEIMNEDKKYYDQTDIIGKTGLEKKYEAYLGGKKGSEIVTVGSSGKVIEVVDRIDQIAGNDVYLTIDSELQKAAYHILEKEIAGILISKLQRDLNYGTKGESASDILTPIYEVYFALINNNIIDINQFDDSNASALETSVYQKYQTFLNNVFDQLDDLLAYDNTITNDKTEDMKEFLDYFFSVITSQEILDKKSIPANDPTYQSYLNNKTSLSSFIQYAIAKNWIDLSKLKVGKEFYIAEEVYGKLINYTKNLLKTDAGFIKKIYHNLIFSSNLTGTEICLLLFDQGVLKYNEDEYNRLKNGNFPAFDFMYEKMTKLEITPAMLALEPCSGSLVVIDVTSGDILALVTYPSYDNNRLANKIDAKYWAKLNADLSHPLLNRPTYERIAPGSTFKMVTSVAALEEGVVQPQDRVLDLGIFEKTNLPAKCNIYPGSHGSVNIVDALKVSCNYFFYEMGFRLSKDSAGNFKDQLGINKLEKYATMFGLNEKSGVELDLNERNPQISDKDSIRSSIGQSNNAFTTVQLARYVTSIANSGITYDLTLLDRIDDKDGNTVLNNNASVNHDLTTLKKSTWESVHEGMYSVVNVNGGSVYKIFKDLGVTVAGKTGTSQISKVNPNNALFVSYAPYEEPEISVTAVIPNGHTSGNAAEFARDIYKLYFKLEDKDALVEGDVKLPENNIAAFSD
jgi:penicillin-binding protein 2